MRALLCAFFLSVLLTTHALGQRVLEGRVTVSKGDPLSGVMVRVSRAGRMVAFCTTDRAGHYRCSIPKGDLDSLTVSFRKINYQEHSQPLLPQTTQMDVSLKPGDFALREVVVKASPVEALGDTILYHLRNFKQAGDHTLEDGLKRLPGIQVDESGTISYMGRDISRFYIEGLDMLGGRYNLATQNIAVDDVTGVEVLRHHQAHKVDKQELTDNVALNIKLSSKVRLKPIGTYEARLGARPGRFLYGAGGTGMLFRTDLQLLGTLKVANDGRMGRNELYDHFGVSSWQTTAERGLPLLAGNRPPVGESRFMDSRNEVVSLNGIRRLTADRQMKANASYSRLRQEHAYQVLAQYPTAAGTYLVTDEGSDFRRDEHRADVNLNFRSDKEEQLLENSLILRGCFADARSAVQRTDACHLGEQDLKTLGVRNELTAIRRVKGWKFHLGSTLQYTETPDNTLDVSKAGVPVLQQQAHSRVFHTQESFYTHYKVFPQLALALPVTFSANANRLQTCLQTDTLAMNALQGWDVSLSLTPRLEYQTPNRNLRAVAGLPLTLLSQDYRNVKRASRLDATRLYANLMAELHYVPNGNVEYKASACLNRSYGDLMDLLTGPIQTDYRTLRARSGILGQSRMSQNRLSFDWQEPLSMWRLSLGANYHWIYSNVMPGQQVSTTNQLFLESIQDNTAHHVALSVLSSKYMLPLKTSLTAQASYHWSRNESLVEQQAMTTDAGGCLVKGEIRTNPIKQLQLTCSLSFQRNFQHNEDSKSHFKQWQQHAKLVYTPVSGLNLAVSTEWQRNEAPPRGTQQSAFLDLSAEYKFKKPKLRLRLELNNVLDARSYQYALYDVVNTYIYHHRLNGRECLLSLVLF